MKPKIFIPFREEADDGFDRNRVEIDGQPLWSMTLDRLKDFNVFIDTNSEEIFEKIRDDSRFNHVIAHFRDISLGEAGVSVNDLIRSFLERQGIKHEPVCQMHITTPLLKVETLLSAFQDVEFSSPYDSVVGCTEIQKRMWREDHGSFVPLNHNPLRLTSSSRLQPVLLENSTFYIFEADTFFKVNNRIGFRPHFYRVPFPESLEITSAEDARLANCLIKESFVQ
ncbi:hypothetical protein [Rubellicoccus peritrichatus]|uniref:Uncharacterized protein n=1 Tax=Rubellicoccus peritrichatus TaxID=3080537 RepID=A0AAQ3LCQ6_9BACT|nr:hypothetical protein [Puniceicoccus sp. CR14]WOO42039.1 hypothetical protein RZN69_02995 [Puniceicoccus sp. CR14]